MSLNWNTTLHHFCEYYAFGFQHEYFNSFSSIFMLISGLLGLFGNSYRINLKPHILGPHLMLCVCSIGSFWFHWTGYYGPGMLDQSSMLFAIWIGSVAMMKRAMKDVNPYITRISLLLPTIDSSTSAFINSYWSDKAILSISSKIS